MLCRWFIASRLFLCEAFRSHRTTKTLYSWSIYWSTTISVHLYRWIYNNYFIPETFFNCMWLLHFFHRNLFTTYDTLLNWIIQIRILQRAPKWSKQKCLLLNEVSVFWTLFIWSHAHQRRDYIAITMLGGWGTGPKNPKTRGRLNNEVFHVFF